MRSKLQPLPDPRNFHGMNLLLQLLAQFLRCLALLSRKEDLVQTGFPGSLSSDIVKLHYGAWTSLKSNQFC